MKPVKKSSQTTLGLNCDLWSQRLVYQSEWGLWRDFPTQSRNTAGLAANNWSFPIPLGLFQEDFKYIINNYNIYHSGGSGGIFSC